MKKLCLFLACWSFWMNLPAAEDAVNQSGLFPTTTESYQIRNQKFGGRLRPENASGADGARIVLHPAE